MKRNNQQDPLLLTINSSKFGMVIKILILILAAIGVIASAEVVVHAASSSPSNTVNSESSLDSSYSKGPEPNMMMSPMMYSAPMEDEMMPMSVGARGGGSKIAHKSAKRSSFSASSSDLGETILNEGSTVNKFDPMIEAMLVRTGSIQATTAKDFDDCQSQLQSTVLNIHGAYIESNQNNGGWKDNNGNIQGRSIYMQVRVPVEMFFKLRDDIIAIFPKGEVGSVSDSVSDVTSQYIDAASRAATLRASLAQLTKLMTHANTVDEVLKVQRELTQVIQQLESKEATMKRLSTQATLSTWNINVNQKQPPHNPDKPKKKKKWSVGHTIKRASKWLHRKLRNLVDVAIFALFALVPLSFLVLFLLSVVRVLRSSICIRVFAYMFPFPLPPTSPP
mmetsp:Transcript_24125/g.31411  ORF Transcript_24125/g.31411 Transcript_24125/m.31411 type:complete len:392 (+) Transcript_24125:61-1236(+)